MPDSAFKSPDLPQIRIVKTIPKATQQQLSSYKHCYMGISLDNPSFYGRSLQALLLWATNNCEQCLVIVGDFLRRYNEHIFSGTAGEAAENASLQSGENYIAQTREIFSRFPEPAVKIIRWKDCLEKEEYKKAKKIIDNLYDSDEAFRSSLQKDAFSFINRQKRNKQNPKVSIENAIDISSKYLLEEVAVFSALSELGWNVEIYPGPELHVLVDIAGGSFRDVPAGLKKRINIELQIDKQQITQEKAT
jgi:tRNA-dependent cyclodipeptide synthase